MADDMINYNLVDTAQSRYDRLTEDREHYLNRGRQCSELTIPTLIPENSFTPSQDFYSPFQSVGSRGVNNLASKLLLLLLPPNQPFFRLAIEGKAKQQVDEQPQLKTTIEKSLAKIEREVMSKIEALALRVPIFEAIKQLIVGGNVLCHIPKQGTMRVFPLNQFVCKRDGEGNILEIVVKESISILSLDEDVRQLVIQKMSKEEIKSETNCDLYTHVYKLNDKKFYVCQEVHGIKIPSSIGEHNADQLPWLSLRMIRVDGEDYGRSYVEEYIGDLKSLEGLSQAMVESSAASAKMVFMVKPNSTTKKRDIAVSRNGDIITGNKDDVSVLQAEKFYDLQTVDKAIGRLEERLQYAFLLNTAIQRQAERVTAQEIRYMANELETAMGGIYSLLSQELQLPLVQLLMMRMGSKNEIPKLPKGSVRPTIITGVEALGRGNDLQKLSEFVGQVAQLAQIYPQAANLLNVGDLVERLATGHGIETEGLIKSPEQLQQEQMQQQQMQMQQQMMDTAQDVAPKVADNVTKPQG
tara:strand:- start:11091 stop:12665 length:1575 start_codon:yes stop_codon:yes gene_type:complete